MENQGDWNVARRNLDFAGNSLLEDDLDGIHQRRDVLLRVERFERRESVGILNSAGLSLP